MIDVFASYIHFIVTPLMLAKKNEQDLTDAIRGPIGTFGLAIIVIAAALAIADGFAPTADDAPDEKPLFGSFFTDAINEGIFYLRWIIYIAILAGGVMIGLTLRISPKMQT